MKRYITSVVYVLVLAGLIALKWLLVPYGSIGFDVLFWAIGVIGAFEFIRATGLIKLQKIAVYIYCALAVPLYAVLSYLAAAGYIDGSIPLFASLILFGACFLFASSAFVFSFNDADVQSTGTTFFALLYCGVLPLVLSCINHLSENSLFAIIFLFVEAMLTDSCAYLFGVTMHKRFPKKMSPVVSPNKTVVGGIGGIVGAVLGGVLCWLIFSFWAGILKYSWALPAVAYLVIISAILGVLIQLGDLFESAIKRKCGIKDMGNILPGHGGALDRFDSMLFTAPVIFLVFYIVAIF